MRLQKSENVIYELRPEANVLKIWFFTKCLPIAFVGGFLSFWCFGFFGGMVAVATKSDSPWPIIAGGIVAIIAIPVLLVLGLIYCRYLRQTYVYYITNQRCVFHGGIVRRVERSVPYHKITDVEMSQNIIERILGISTVKIFTPGTGSMMVSPFGGQRAEIAFEGLKDNETPAAAINEILRKFRSTGE
ncbi:PH domain-containing protein [bacterium]|nr:PH domain-containing protein [bacterium]